MATCGGVNTVLIDGEYIHITDLNEMELSNAWTKRQRELNNLYEINAKANQGWRGVILRIIGVHLPDRKMLIMGGIDSKGQALYESN